MAVKLQFEIYLYKGITLVKLQNKLNLAVVKLFASVLMVLFACSANCGQIVNLSTPQSDQENSNETLSTIRLSPDELSNEFSILKNIGIIESTDFAKDVEFSSQNNSLSPAGFAKKISLTSSVDYDTNPALDNTRKRSVWIYTLIPQALLEYTGEHGRVYLDSALVVQRPSNEEILPDRDDPRLTLGWARTYESGSYGLYASYLQFLSRAQEIRTIGVFNNISNSDSTQRTRAFGANWEHKFAQRWNVLTNVDYTQDAFSGGVNLIGSKTLGVKSKLSYEYTERLDTYGQVGYVQINPDSPFEDTDLVRLALGADYLISDAFKGSFRVAQYDITGAQTGSGWEAGVRFLYETSHMGYSAELNRELTAAGGVGGFQKTDTFRLGCNYNISDKDIVSASYSLAKFREDLQIGLPKQEIQQIDAIYKRILGFNWNARANLTYRELKSDRSNQGLIMGVSVVYDGLSF